MVKKIWEQIPSGKSIPNNSNKRKVGSLGILSGNIWDQFINKDITEYI